MERVPAGAKFSLEIVLDIYTDENEKELKELLLRSLELVRNDYLGGSGSRGYGQVMFHIEQVIELDTASGHHKALEADDLKFFTERISA